VADWLTNLLRNDIGSGNLNSGRGPADPSRLAAMLVYERAGTTTVNGSTGFVDAGSCSGFRPKNGNDTLAGGLGADRFVLDDGDSSAATPDVIRDFVRGGTDDAFVEVGALTGAAGQLMVPAARGGWQVLGDTNGDGVADFVLMVTATGSFGAAGLVL
jgi:Ca2+-binding RTX toxin-like protein